MSASGKPNLRHMSRGTGCYEHKGEQMKCRLLRACSLMKKRGHCISTNVDNEKHSQEGHSALGVVTHNLFEWQLSEVFY